MQQTLKIGTRGSPLALWQAHAVRDALLAAHPVLSPDRVEIVIVKTTGDRILDRPLAEIGGKGLFTKELEEGLISGALDCAVHSTKDMPTSLPPGLGLTCFLKREDPRDALITRDGQSFRSLPEGALIGTASLRRQAQILAARPDLRITGFRGNVGTRLKKLNDGVVDATLLAFAGIKRLGMSDKATEILDTDLMLPAPAQGAICIESRLDNHSMTDLLAPLGHYETERAIVAERAFLAALEGNCRTPIAALAKIDGATLSFEGRLLSLDGTTCLIDIRSGAVEDAQEIGDTAGRTLKAKAGADFFRLIAQGQPQSFPS